jgi:DNA processing protein
MVQLVTTQKKQARRAPGGPYVPPSSVFELSAEDVGLDPVFGLKFPILYGAGKINLLTQPAVAIVGSRGASEGALQRVRRLVRVLCKSGVVVMSGLAEGVDRAAHQAALEEGGSTIAVIGTPIDKAYPAAHARLQEAIYRDHLLISPFPVGTRTFPSHFPARNQVMARISRATVIIEASDTSGTLHQAAECERAGQPLFIARSVVENRELTWPSRFKSAMTLDDPEQVLRAIGK